MDLNHVFANRSDEDKIYPLTVSEIAEEQTKDKGLQQQRRASLKYPTPSIGGLFYGVASQSVLGRDSNARSENKNL